MVADRWFFGMLKLANYQSSVMHYTTSDKNTFLISYEASYDNVAGMQFIIHGVASDSIRRPSDIISNGANIVVDGVGAGTIHNDELCIRLDEDTRMTISIDPGATTSTGRVSFTTIELNDDVPDPDRIRDYVVRGGKSSNTRTFTTYQVFSATTAQFFEYSVAGKTIIQPAAQAPPAVADELNVVSTDTNDDAAGIGARTIKFKYLDDNLVEHTSSAISMDGTTPVDIVGTYDDVFVILESWVVIAGTLGRNIGSILFQDT